MKSISTSGHKFGLAPLGVGWVVWRDVAELPDDLIFHVNYLGGDMPVFQINFSRPAGQIVAQYYDFLRLGREGYRRVHDGGLRHRAVPRRARSSKLGPFELLCDSNPHTGIPTVTWRIARGRRPRLHAVRPGRPAAHPRLAGAGLHRSPARASDIAVQRILVRQGVSRDLAALLLDDFRDAVAHFDKHPVTVSDDQGGVERLQPPLTAQVTRAGWSMNREHDAPW